MNLSLILKALGVKIAPEQLQALERMIPQIVPRANQAIGAINAAVLKADQRAADIIAKQWEMGNRLVRLEEKIDRILNLRSSGAAGGSLVRIDAIGRERIAIGDGGSHPAGSGAGAANGAD